MSDATEISGPTDSPVRSTTSIILLLAGLVALPLVVLLAIVCLRGGSGSSGTGTDFAEAVSYLVSDASSWITGQILNINGGLLME